MKNNSLFASHPLGKGFTVPLSTVAITGNTFAFARLKKKSDSDRLTTRNQVPKT